MIQQTCEKGESCGLKKQQKMMYRLSARMQKMGLLDHLMTINLDAVGGESIPGEMFEPPLTEGFLLLKPDYVGACSRKGLDEGITESFHVTLRMVRKLEEVE